MAKQNMCESSQRETLLGGNFLHACTPYKMEVSLTYLFHTSARVERCSLQGTAPRGFG